MSPGTLRKKYLPRRRDERPPAAHPATAAPATRAQVQHPQAPLRLKGKTEDATIPHGPPRVKLTRFKPGFEWETE